MNTGHRAVSGDPRHILAIIVTRIGDSLLCTPALRAISERWPDARITVLAHAKRRDVLENLPFVDEVLSMSWHTGVLARCLPGGRYDLAFVFSDDAKLIRIGLGLAKKVIAFAGSLPIRHSRLQLVTQPPAIPAVLARLSLVESVGAVTQDHRLVYQLTAEEQAWAAAWRATHSSPLVALQLHSFPTKAHRDWPLRHFVRLIELIREAYPAATFVITGDAVARSSAQALGECFGACVLCVAGDLSLRQTAALLSTVDLYVGVDTGPTHLAGALGVPMVGLYHAAYPGCNLAPLQHPRCRFIEHPATGTAQAAEADMADISPEQVWAAAHQLLSIKFQ